MKKYYRILIHNKNQMKCSYVNVFTLKDMKKMIKEKEEKFNKKYMYYEITKEEFTKDRIHSINYPYECLNCKKRYG